ncbi:MAG: twin-arginine translocase subunit TatC [Francisellaceae bacterium]|jgi:sec-independent protein translocase protein TatC|nr:twin-arginine translocase subunit TatC [Francisellaceae bacterium]MBT6208306.1 twin-arginine translocase subunit TatC [Francisellaceae bacterium]MBT6538728.1 twin-arginine translocase subunit TatC [Francisellaceae bacterium]
MIVFISELRSRLIKSIVFLVSVFTITLIFIKPIFSYLVRPLIFNDLSAQIITTSLTSTVIVPMKLSFYISIILSLPFFLAQLWLFVSPALFTYERRAIRPLFIISFTLLITGIMFALLVMYPITIKFLIGFAPDNVNVMADITNLLDLILGMSLGAGLAFQVPLVTYIIVYLEICTKEQLHHLRPLVIVFALILGMILTPPDIISQITLAIPIWFLFELGLLFCPKPRNLVIEGESNGTIVK